MAGYVRQSLATISNGQPLTAPPVSAEFNQLSAAFSGSTGHGHTGASGDAPPIPLATSVSGYLPAVHGGNGGRNNVSATTNPSITDDSGDGYAVGSIWINTSAIRVFLCTSASIGAAVWQEILYNDPTDSFLPSTHDTVDLGSDLVRFKSAYLTGLSVTETNAAQVPLTVKGASGQTGDILKVQDSAGADFFRVQFNGRLFSSNGLVIEGNDLNLNDSTGIVGPSIFFPADAAPRGFKSDFENLAFEGVRTGFYYEGSGGAVSNPGVTGSVPGFTAIMAMNYFSAEQQYLAIRNNDVRVGAYNITNGTLDWWRVPVSEDDNSIRLVIAAGTTLADIDANGAARFRNGMGVFRDNLGGSQNVQITSDAAANFITGNSPDTNKKPLVVQSEYSVLQLRTLEANQAIQFYTGNTQQGTFTGAGEFQAWNGSLFTPPGAGFPTAKFRGNSGQTGDLIQFQNSAGTVLSRFGPNGDLIMEPGQDIGVGTTNATVGNGNTENGVYIDNGGYIAASRANAAAGYFNRGGTGNLVEFRREGTLNGRVSMNTSSVSYLTTSDARLKENVVDAEDAGAIVDLIRVRSFDMAHDAGVDHYDYGFVAQELHDVYPDAVSVGDTEEEMWGVDYAKLVPVLVKEIQSLRRRIEQLEAGV